MSKVLIVYGYYDEADHYGKFLDTVIETLQAHKVDVEVINTYAFTRSHLKHNTSAENDNAANWFRGLRSNENDALIRVQQDQLLSSDKIIFIYPIWWESIPPFMLTWVSEVFRSVSFRVGNDGRPIGQWGGNREILIMTTAGFANNIRQEQFQAVLPPRIKEQIESPDDHKALSELCQTYPLRTALQYAGMSSKIIEHHFDGVTQGDEPALLHKVRQSVAKFMGDGNQLNSSEPYLPSGGPSRKRRADAIAKTTMEQLAPPRKKQRRH